MLPKDSQPVSRAEPSVSGGQSSGLRRYWAVLLMLLPIFLFFGYWGRLAYQASQKRQNTSVQATETAAPDRAAAAAAAVDFAALSEEIAAGKGALKDQQEKLWQFVQSDPPPSPQDKAAALSLLGEVQLDLLYSTELGPGKSGHLVEAGQSLALLAQKYGSTVPAIVRANNLLGTNVQPGQHLVVPELGTIELHFYLAGGSLVIYWQGRYLKSYAITAMTTAAPAELVGEGTVTERLALHAGAIVPFGEDAYYEAEKSIKLGTPGSPEIKGPITPDTSVGAGNMFHMESKPALEEIFPLLTASTRVIIRE